MDKKTAVALVVGSALITIHHAPTLIALSTAVKMLRKKR
jgi:hypothetical protein